MILASSAATSSLGVALEGRVAVVTGGTRGIGRSIASTLADNGAEVVVVGRKAPVAEAAAAELSQGTGRVVSGRGCHVGSWEQIDALVDWVYDELGRVDILVNNAGIAPTYDSLVGATEELFDKTVAVNLKGPFRLCARIGSQMKENGGGAIVNISSTGAVRPQASFVPYAATKAGLNAMTVGLAHALGPEVRVNGVMPGLIETDITASWDWDFVNARLEGFASGRIGQPDEIASAVLYLVSDAASYITGTILNVDGGER